jgi:hypothetical protein
MPALREALVERAGVAMEQFGLAVSRTEHGVMDVVSTLTRRVNIPFNSSSPAGLVEANTVDPWNKSGKYALAYVYFCIPLLVILNDLLSRHRLRNVGFVY